MLCLKVSISAMRSCVSCLASGSRSSSVTEQIVSMVSFACRCFSSSRRTPSGIVGMDHQAAGHNEFSQLVNCGNVSIARQCNQLLASILGQAAAALDASD